MEGKLHGELIQDILLRLPVKSLVRFKCVCKSWFSLVSDPHFANSHFELSPTPSDKLFYITCSGSEARSIDIDASLYDDSAVVTLIPPFPNTGNRSVKILGSCRGLVLLGMYTNSNLYLWNPSSGFHRQLSHSEIRQTSLFGISIKSCLYGFGYDPSTDDYLIVVLGSIQSVLYSLRTNSWRQYPNPCTYHHNQTGLLFNGAIHWLAKRHYESAEVIVVFDLKGKKFSGMLLPDGDLAKGVFRNLGIMGGCLSVCYWDNSTTQVWVMKEYQVQSSWTMFEISTRELYPLCLAKGGEVVALSCVSAAELMKFNDKGDLLEHRKYCDDPYGCC